MPHNISQDEQPIAAVAEDAGLPSISIGKLMAGDAATKETLLRASSDLGFFYVDIRDFPSDNLESKIDSITETAFEFYRLPQEEKNTWEVNKDHQVGEEVVMGYKPAGIQTGPVAGKKDGFEGFLIFENALRSASRDRPIHGPKIFQERRDLVESVNAHLGDIGRVILDNLSRSLGYAEKDNLALRHQADQPSTTALGLLKYLPYDPKADSVGHIPHTDIGSLSMVFSSVGGLQVYHPRRKAWMFIEPRDGHMVCNIGDSVEFLSDSVLHSSLHRVIPHPAQQHKVKLTVVYLMRPQLDTVFVDRDGKEWNTLDWHNRKNRLFAEEMAAQSSNNTLTGRNIEEDLWDEASKN